MAAKSALGDFRMRRQSLEAGTDCAKSGTAEMSEKKIRNIRTQNPSVPNKNRYMMSAVKHRRKLLR